MNSKKIIIIEDNLIVVEDLKSSLAQCGYTIIASFSSGEAFLNNLSNLNPDLVIIDLLLDGQLSGIETAEILGKQTSIPVIFLTANSEKEKFLEARKTDPYGYIIKPFNVDELETTIEITLYKHKIFQQLEEKEKRFEAIIQNSPSGIITTDTSGNILHANQKAQTLFKKYTDKTLTEINAYNILDNQQKMFFYDHFLNQKTTSVNNILILNFNGHCSLKFETICSKIKVKGKINLVFQLNDLTGHYDSLKKMKMLTQVISAIEESLYITDSDNNITYINQTFLKTFDLESKEVYGKNIYDLIFTNVEQTKIDLIQERVSHTNWSGELKLSKPGLEAFPASVTISRIENEHLYFVGVIRDISTEETLKKQFNQMQRLESIGKLASGVAHDFNNMLSVISGYSELILNQISPDNPFREYIREIFKAGERASDLTRQLLLFSKTDVGKIERININDIVADLSKMLERLIGENIKLVLELSDEIYDIMIDKGQLEQALMNLAVNARDAIHDNMQEKNQIQISTDTIQIDKSFTKTHLDARPGNFTKLTVSDTGSGIPEDVRRKIFDPFFTTKGIHSGTGLGLSTVYAIVQKFQGFIIIDSQPGSGTEFHLYFPKAEQSKVKIKKVKSEAQKGRGRILIVEDSPPLLKVTDKLLRSLGYNTDKAKNASEALAIAKDNNSNIDLLFTDIILPESNGFLVYEKIKQINPQIKVLFTSGYNDEYLKANNIKLTDNNFIRKPFDRREVSNIISTILT